MKRWRNFAVVGGLLTVLMFATERFLLVRTLWSDVRNLGPDLVDVVVFIGTMGVIFLAILRAGDLLWRAIRPKRKGNFGKSEYSSPKRPRYFWLFGLSSLALAIASESLTEMRTPGARIVGRIFIAARVENLTYLPPYFIMLVVVDSAVFFAMLWGGYLLWGKVLGKGQVSPRVG
jgi:hypothetical protein